LTDSAKTEHYKGVIQRENEPGLANQDCRSTSRLVNLPTFFGQLNGLLTYLVGQKVQNFRISRESSLFFGPWNTAVVLRKQQECEISSTFFGHCCPKNSTSKSTVQSELPPYS